MTRVLWLVPLAFLFLGTSCIRGTWSRTQANREIVEVQYSTFVLGESRLGDCLRQLGAPLYVWEEPGGKTALAWGWGEESGTGLNLSLPLAQYISATMDYEDLDRALLGLVLAFDEQFILQDRRLGILAELTREAKRRRPVDPGDQ